MSILRKITPRYNPHISSSQRYFYNLQKLIISHRKGFHFVDFDDILYIEADSNYTTIYTIDGEKKTVSKTLKFVALKLNHPQFFRIHAKYMINLNYMSSIEKEGQAYFTKLNKTCLPISKCYFKKFKEYINL